MRTVNTVDEKERKKDRRKRSQIKAVGISARMISAELGPRERCRKRQWQVVVPTLSGRGLTFRR